MRYLSTAIAFTLLFVCVPYLAQSANSSASAWSIDGIFPPTGYEYFEIFIIILLFSSPVDGLTKITIYSTYLQGKNYSSHRFPRVKLKFFSKNFIFSVNSLKSANLDRMDLSLMQTGFTVQTSATTSLNTLRNSPHIRNNTIFSITLMSLSSSDVQLE